MTPPLMADSPERLALGAEGAAGLPAGTIPADHSPNSDGSGARLTAWIRTL
ncbi:hypothetical protein D3C76_1785940 [compost metagenome]